MKRVCLSILFFSLLFVFASCDDDDGSSMNEDYAGIWYEFDGDDFWKYDFTDDDGTVYFKDEGVYSPFRRYDLDKESGNSFTIDLEKVYVSGQDITSNEEGWYDDDALLAFGISKGWWSNEHEMIQSGFDFETEVLLYYTLDAEGSCLELQSNDDISYLFSSEALATP